jgi:ribosomal protein S6--L-glutamate ligase
MSQGGVTMIVSFHPMFEADMNIICAGRRPNSEDLAAIQSAQAVVLAQGCYRSLYEMARANCVNVFPNYDARFRYPGKLGQAKLFRELDIRHPATEIFANVAAFQNQYSERHFRLPWPYPVVFKLDWGGQGETVYLIESDKDLKEYLDQTAHYEKSGQTGFLLQEYIPSNGRTLRVVVIGRRLISYWRIQPDIDGFHTNLRSGAILESESQPALRQEAEKAIRALCRATGINLAGFDVIFATDVADPEPLLLEINYFFGRKGLGGSAVYYEILQTEIQAWLDGWELSS